jgi:anthranilate phosphoribosyltransferase
LSESAAIRFPRVFEEITGPGGAQPDTIRRAFDAILAGAWTPVEVAGFAVALKLRGEDATVIATAVESLRAVMVAVDHGLPLVFDTCGTGGDGMGTLNISTAAAIVVAACGIPVAKHGNRSVSSRAGSADVLEALGLPIDVPPLRQADILRQTRIAFLFAPAHHPAMRHAAAARRELAIPTLFNALGPVANPARATHQLIGTFADSLRPILAATLGRLGSRRAWVVRGDDGMDEVSPCGPTRVTALAGASVTEHVIHPEDFGLSPLPRSAVAGGDAAENAASILAILRGEPHPARDAVLLNAAAALAVAREVEGRRAFPDLTQEAAEAVRSGAALNVLSTWREVARGTLAPRPSGPASSAGAP